MPQLRRFAMPRTLAIALATVALLVSAFPVSSADPTDPFGRQPDDPIRVAREQRVALEARLAGQQDRLAALTAAGTKLTSALAKTSDSLASIMVDLGQLRLEVDAAQADLDAAVAERDSLQQQVESLDWSLDNLAEQADELAADLDSRRRELGARLADAYRAGKTGLWEQVIAAGSFLDAVVQQQGALALGEHDQQLAISIQTDQGLLDQQRLELRQLRYQTDQLRESVEAQAEQITLDRDQLVLSTATLADLEARTLALQAAQQAKYQQVLDNQARVAAIIARQTRQQAKLSGQISKLVEKERHSGRLPSAFNGSFRWPLVGDISQDFGCTHFVLEPPRGDCDHFHTGIDIVGPVGSPIRAPGDGVVLWVGYETDVPRKDANYYVMIAHSDHLVTLFGHLQPKSPARIRIGAKVLEGQILGWEGDTGNSTGAHLHWGVFLDGEPQNPRFFL